MKQFPLIDETISHKYSAATFNIHLITVTVAGALMSFRLVIIRTRVRVPQARGPGRARALSAPGAVGPCRVRVRARSGCGDR